MLMKSRFKKILLLAIVILSIVCIYPVNTKAFSSELSYIDISDVKNLDVKDLSFSNITFKDYSDTSTRAFGLSGEVVNNSNRSITYSSRVSYYDKDYNLITEAGSSNIALTGSNPFNLMFNLDILGEYSTDDIKYYSLSVSINDDLVSSSSNTPSENSIYSSYDYVIDNYDVNIMVNSNNTFDITETITAYFNTPKHGIFRTIPLSNKIVRLDGSTSTNRTQVTNLSVSDEYSVSRENGNYKIQIGSASRTLTGEKTYTIKYTYNLGKDPIKDYDELYYNIIGSEWDTVIGNVTFNLTMPKEFDASKLGFSKGKVGSTNNDGINYTVNGNKISGSYDGVLNKGEALTVRCELPEGYFVDAGLAVNSNIYLMFIIPIATLIISFLLWFIFGRDNRVVETVEFYPPEGFNSLEVGFLYKGKANSKDVVSLLIYLANKGYIKISDNTDESLFSKADGFKITKLKDYDGNDANERLFLGGLFKDTAVSGEVTKDELYDKFYVTTNKILDNINDKENKNKIFEKKASRKSIIVVILILISLFTTVAIPTLDYAGTGEVAITLFICAFYIPFYAVGIFAKIPLLFRVIWLGFTIFHSSVFFSALPITDAVTSEPIYLIGVIVGVLCLIGMILCFKFMPKRTPYGNEILGKIRGFKNFLETAEKDKLEAMVNSNPTYFYDILPFTYVLGVSDKWIKKFETINMQAPSWYDGHDAFSVVAFGTFIGSTMTSAQSVMASSSSSSSSGGSSSGGGSSGGGSGGGGGGSW